MRRINLADASHEFSNADLKFKFATYLMIHRDGRSFEDIFEMRRDRDAFAVAVEARAKVAPAKAILDERQAAVDGLQPGYDAALAAYELAKSDRIAAEQKLSDEIARQEAKEAAKQQAAYTPKHLAGTETAQPGSLAQTGDRAGLIGETFVIGGTVLVAAGVFLDQKKRREQM